MLQKTIIFNVQQNKVVCKPQNLFFRPNRIDGFGDLNLFF
jgi:hypothetical protein